MDALVDSIIIAPIQDVTLRAMLDAAMFHFYAFSLVLVRLSGLMTVGPVFGQSLVPANVRVLLIFTVSLLVTPVLNDHGRTLFIKLDKNQDRRLTRDEVPPSIAARYESLLKVANKSELQGLEIDEFRPTLLLPRTVLDYAWIGAGEFALGLVLGLGVLTILSGLQVAGDLIDQQSGLALGEIANPGLDITGSVTGQFLFTFATTVLLVMRPCGYHLAMVSALIETFQTIPLGEALVTGASIDLLRDLVHQSLVLGIQISAPLLASMSLVALTFGFLGHTVPQINILVVGFPVRAVVSLVVLATSLSGVAKVCVDLVPTVIDALRHSLTGL